jgi:hypothetical protein
LLGLAWVYAASEHEGDSAGDPSANIEIAILAGGLGLIAAGAVVDIATTPSAVRRANQRPAHRIELTGIAPTPRGFAITAIF